MNEEKWTVEYSHYTASLYQLFPSGVHLSGAQNVWELKNFFKMESPVTFHCGDTWSCVAVAVVFGPSKGSSSSDRPSKENSSWTSWPFDMKALNTSKRQEPIIQSQRHIPSDVNSCGIPLKHHFQFIISQNILPFRLNARSLKQSNSYQQTT
jgi:hypothetical protein